LEGARTKHVEAGLLLSSPLVYASLKQIGELARAKRLPLICLFGEFPKAGGFIAYGPNLGDLFRRCGDYVAKILHGAKPSDLPIQRPERFDLVINLKTAEALVPRWSGPGHVRGMRSVARSPVDLTVR
jgi:putative tryptophan/tyrosine transport system substrate-binding protein